MRVAHRHLDVGVSKQALHDRQRHAIGDQPRSKGVAQNVPAYSPQTGAPARLDDLVSRRRVEEGAAILAMENELIIGRYFR